MKNPITPIEYMRMRELKEAHERGLHLRKLDVDLLFELLGRLWEATEKG